MSSIGMLVSDLIIASAGGYLFHKCEEHNQEALQNRKVSREALRDSFKGLAAYAIQMFQILAATGLSLISLESLNLEKTLLETVVRISFAPLVILSCLNALATPEDQPGVFKFPKEILWVGERIGTITDTIMIVSSLVIAYFSSFPLALLFAGSLAFNLCERANLIKPPIISQAIDLLRFVALEIVLVVSGQPLLQLTAVGLLAHKIYHLYVNHISENPIVENSQAH